MNEIPGLNLEKDEFGFEGQIILPAWQGFQSRNGAYAAQDTATPSNGRCNIRTGGDMVEDEPTIKNYHIEAYNFLIANQEKIKENILESLIVEYKKLQALYGYEDEEKEEFMPDVDNVEDFKKLIGLANVHLMNVEKDGCGYVGYEFGCLWDDEHGLGVMTHQDRILEIGGADTAFLTWVAKKDLKKN